MKKTILLLLIISYSQLFAQTTPKLYLNFVTHNEGNYTYSSATYTSTRDQLTQMAQLCQSKGAKWHLQSDYKLLEAVIAYDKGSVTTNTNGQNILQYLTQTYPSTMRCDPHSHEEKYNYSDIAYLFSSLGVDPGTIIGGYLYDTIVNGQDWQLFQNPVAGLYYPSYSWAAEIFWGAASWKHIADPEYYGIWKPKSMTDFYSHDSTNQLIVYGVGCRLEINATSTISEILGTLKPILDAIQNGNATSNGFYTTNIFFQESCLSNSSFLNSTLPELMDSINNYVAKGQMEWMFIQDVVAKWKLDYNSQPFLFSCDSVSSDNTQAVTYCSSAGSVTNFEYLNSVTFASKTNISGNNKGYADFSSTTFNVNAGQAYSLSLKPGFSSTKVQKEYFKVWIDYNQDGDFDDSDEEVYKGTTSSKLGCNSNITIASSAKAGNTRMRISMKYGAYATSCEAIARGEVEDYTLNIVSSAKTSAIEELSSPEFNLYPNPAKENVSIELLKQASSLVTIKMFDMQGREVYTIRTVEMKQNIDLRNIPDGLYLVSVQSSESKHFQKLVVSH